ncbi:glycosyl hydrolase family 28-related protein [Heyndrickxia acidicola]|uniref:Glycosyl hydrolase family 28-related protein n=1 Tax=Heyndrickxia acidicola TaxID=209389 RepID=A0ABU6MAS6_9BACI|nr:glycosyl hydrolase family 28-related protein [Heyndrickxia acidicola]MED1201773.1 glycosyl hydrolase family 28-related protein [Heyndrickxia acidicola]
MNRRKFILNFILWILAFFFGFTFKKEDDIFNFKKNYSNLEDINAQSTENIQYPILDTETGVTSKNYPYGDVRRYGAVGDASKDDTQAFLNAISSTPSRGGKVFVPKAEYKITGTITLKSGVLLELDSQAEIWVDGDFHGIQLALNSRVNGGVITTSLSNYSHALIYIPSTIYAGVSYHVTGIRDMSIYGNGSGIGIFLDASSNSGYLDSVTFDNVAVAKIGTGIKLYTPLGSSAWTNGNQFTNISIQACKTDIDLENCGGNIFTGLQIQPSSGIEQVGINLVNSHLNQFLGQLWDPQNYPSGSAIKCDTTSQENFFSVGLDRFNANTITDNSTGGNVFISQTGIATNWLALTNTSSLPTATSQFRGRLAVVFGNGSTTADIVYICLESATGTYSWKQLISG